MGYWCLHAWLCVKTPHDENIHWLMSKKAVAFAVAGYIQLEKACLVRASGRTGLNSKSLVRRKYSKPISLAVAEAAQGSHPGIVNWTQQQGL